jgi:eukaryotic-like serine/threonine-protein kinase
MAENRLSGAERIAVANHAATCSSCRDVISALMGWDPASATPLTEGATIDRYVIESRLGAGGMGVVYAARDPDLGRRVAVKLVRAGDDDERLRREAQALAKLSHPNVVAVHDVGKHGDQLFIAMALVEGADLRRWLRTSPAVTDILRHLLAAGRGLAAAHAAGLIHRDLKPDNIFVSDTGQASSAISVSRVRSTTPSRRRVPPMTRRRHRSSPSPEWCSARRATWRRSNTMASRRPRPISSASA